MRSLDKEGIFDKKKIPNQPTVPPMPPVKSPKAEVIILKPFKFYISEKRDWGSQDQEKAGIVFAEDIESAESKVRDSVCFIVGKCEIKEVDIIEFPYHIFRDMEFEESNLLYQSKPINVSNDEIVTESEVRIKGGQGKPIEC